jgi:probable HAF family extracellular repeat protein
LGGSFVVPSDLDDRGDVVGYAETAEGAIHAFSSTDGSTIDLGTLGGLNSEATAVNRRGQVVGDSAVGPEPYQLHAVLWDEGEAIDLGTLDGGLSSQALDINRRGEIVGWSLDEHGVEHAVRWTVDC